MCLFLPIPFLEPQNEKITNDLFLNRYRKKFERDLQRIIALKNMGLGSRNPEKPLDNGYAPADSL
jgi:hypothetical protein